ERLALGLLQVEVDYADEARVRRWIEQEGHALDDPGYGMTVRLSIQMPLAVRDQAADAIRDLTHGRAAITKAPLAP
ncbi:MAG: hypothetical protein QOJ04_2583, partial [Caballeronia sp.]|nr:hypothetical protein [Caballeronia sp.]